MPPALVPVDKRLQTSVPPYPGEHLESGIIQPVFMVAVKRMTIQLIGHDIFDVRPQTSMPFDSIDEGFYCLIINTFEAFHG
jgi:hypothetical protein